MNSSALQSYQKKSVPVNPNAPRIAFTAIHSILRKEPREIAQRFFLMKVFDTALGSTEVYISQRGSEWSFHRHPELCSFILETRNGDYHDARPATPSLEKTCS